MGEVKVIGTWSSAFVRRVEMALKLKGVEYEFVEENLRNKSPLLLQLNPIHKKVPILLHNGKIIVESLIILEYIDEVWEGPSLLPKDPYQRAMARFWANLIDDKWIPSTRKVFFSSGEEQEKFKEEATRTLYFLENEIKGKKFFGGDDIGFVDIAANCIAYWIPIVSKLVGIELITEEKFPHLCRWTNDYCNNTFVKENLPDKDALHALLGRWVTNILSSTNTTKTSV